MKKFLILSVSLLSIMSIAAFAGCDKGNGGSDMKTPEKVTRMVTVEENGENADGATDGNEDGVNDGCPDDKCPDGNCRNGGRGRRMPKNKFGHKHGRPVKKDDLH